MSAGWSCCVLSPGGDVWLEQLSADGEDWFGEGPAGTEMGAVATVVRAARRPGRPRRGSRPSPPPSAAK